MDEEWLDMEIEQIDSCRYNLKCENNMMVYLTLTFSTEPSEDAYVVISIPDRTIIDLHHYIRPFISRTSNPGECVFEFNFRGLFGHAVRCDRMSVGWISSNYAELTEARVFAFSDSSDDKFYYNCKVAHYIIAKMDHFDLRRENMRQVPNECEYIGITVYDPKQEFNQHWIQLSNCHWFIPQMRRVGHYFMFLLDKRERSNVVLQLSDDANEYTIRSVYYW